jgi:acetyltransferase
MVTTQTELKRFHLRDGRDVWLRPLAASDAPALMALYERLSPQSIRRRFMQLVPACKPADAEALAAVDQVERVAIAVVPDTSERDRIIAVGRFHGDGSERAELAMLVEDDYQHTGLGRLLLARLLEEAERRGLRVLDGIVQYDNQPMLRLLRTSDRQLEVTWHGGDTLDFRLHVTAAAA